jgi:threonine aldolase
MYYNGDLSCFNGPWSEENMEVINMRSDTQTLPTDSMRDAMKNAALGDSSYDEDPTVNRLEEMAAKLLGKQKAMLVISGTMGNLISMMVHTEPGDEVIIDPESHIFYYECGGLSNIAGLMPMPVPSHKGMLDPDDVARSIREPSKNYPVPRLLCLENTHNRSGGRVVPLDLHKKLCRIAKENGLSVHLDGARIFNAAIASGVPASAFAEDVDSVMFCLSKGLSCPLGSVIVGSREFIENAKRYKKRLGGGMRQAGIIAACGIVAMEEMVDRLKEDHKNARLFAAGVDDIEGLEVDLESVETNMVYIDHSKSGRTTEDAVLLLKGAGVLVSGRPPHQIRVVINRHHDRKVMEQALKRMRGAFER